jgi:hypothetical protein
MANYTAVIEELKQTKYVLMQKMAQVDTALTVLVQLNNKPAENCDTTPKTKLSAAGRAKIVAAQRARRAKEAAAKAAKKGKK